MKPLVRTLMCGAVDNARKVCGRSQLLSWSHRSQEEKEGKGKRPVILWFLSRMRHWGPPTRLHLFPVMLPRGPNLLHNFWETLIQAIVPNCRAPSVPVPSPLLLFFRKITTRNGCLDPGVSHPPIHSCRRHPVHSCWPLLSQGLLMAMI